MLCLSARALLKLGDTNSAANRAYYAMHAAASAALMAKGVQNTRTHRGLIRMFSLHLVKSGALPDGMMGSLARGHEIRLLADYGGNFVKPTVAEEIVEKAEAFVTTIKTLLFDKQPDPPKLDSSSDSSPSP